MLLTTAAAQSVCANDDRDARARPFIRCNKPFFFSFRHNSSPSSVETPKAHEIPIEGPDGIGCPGPGPGAPQVYTRGLAKCGSRDLPRVTDGRAAMDMMESSDLTGTRAAPRDRGSREEWSSGDARRGTLSERGNGRAGKSGKRGLAGDAERGVEWREGLARTPESVVRGDAGVQVGRARSSGKGRYAGMEAAGSGWQVEGGQRMSD
ncbi:hypothetical protein BV20DRAFT_250276 [Pilatotrama ljubarskyi]|nr:hypothetical protein BV20DRAFT_250276 [Pilatotrama ljubarskyi]